jgi:hypothetical protein
VRRPRKPERPIRTGLAGWFRGVSCLRAPLDTIALEAYRRDFLRLQLGASVTSKAEAALGG